MGSGAPPLLLLDVDGVLCPFRAPWSAGAYICPEEQGWRRERYESAGLDIWVSERNAERLRRLAGAFELVWATGWAHAANAVIGPLHALAELPVVELDWRAQYVDSGRSWKLPAIEAYVGFERPCAWIDDDLPDDAERWARERRAPTLLLPADNEVGLTDELVERALAFAAALEQG